MKFPHDVTAEAWFADLRWRGEPYCPYCASDNVLSGAAAGRNVSRAVGVAAALAPSVTVTGRSRRVPGDEAIVAAGAASWSKGDATAFPDGPH